MGSSTCWHDGYCNKEKKSTARFGSELFCSSPPFRRPLLFSPLSLLKNALCPRTPRLDEASREELETRQSGRVRQTNSAYITKYGGRDSWRAVVGSRIHPRGGCQQRSARRPTIHVSQGYPVQRSLALYVYLILIFPTRAGFQMP